MPFRLEDEFRAKVQFVTSAQMPMLVYEACLATGTVSNTVYYQHAVCEALARDLGLDYDDLVANLPRPHGPSAHLFPPDKPHPLSRYGPPIAYGEIQQEVR